MHFIFCKLKKPQKHEFHLLQKLDHMKRHFREQASKTLESRFEELHELFSTFIIWLQHPDVDSMVTALVRKDLPEDCNPRLLGRLFTHCSVNLNGDSLWWKYVHLAPEKKNLANQMRTYWTPFAGFDRNVTHKYF